MWNLCIVRLNLKPPFLDSLRVQRFWLYDSSWGFTKQNKHIGLEPGSKILGFMIPVDDSKKCPSTFVKNPWVSQLLMSLSLILVPVPVPVPGTPPLLLSLSQCPFPWPSILWHLPCYCPCLTSLFLSLSMLLTRIYRTWLRFSIPFWQLRSFFYLYQLASEQSGIPQPVSQLYLKATQFYLPFFQQFMWKHFVKITFIGGFAKSLFNTLPYNFEKHESFYIYELQVVLSNTFQFIFLNLKSTLEH